ncbi:HYC_CC_PP family protein [Aequorivita xiaoshiensis]|uniref:Secreted protein n=1 Tax=Aequorivita xiaoshiensis TaxID=2874476 RepID=A0A9X1R2H6_9FLAO|nr:hypothetical protein [Aequorivita xiaoshiensis]MCG2431089.1 hypothetical protein [Aequorivita xiaoshiensis]
MNSIFHKIVSVFMAILVMVTTMSFTIDMHYCGEMLVDYSLTQSAHSCGMDMEKPTSDCEIQTLEDSCCSDKQIFIEGQDELKHSFDTLSLEQQTFVASFFYSYINLFEDLDTNIIPFRNYNPPFLIRDIQKLHETYLI